MGRAQAAREAAAKKMGKGRDRSSMTRHGSEKHSEIDRGRQRSQEKQGDACGLAINFKHDKGSRTGWHDVASSGEHRKVRGPSVRKGRTTCTNFRHPVQWTSSDAIGREALQCREMQSHDENETVNNCHATSTLYARKNIRSCYALSLVSSCLSK